MGCGSLTGSCPGGVCGAEGSTAPGGMHSNLLLFLQTACISPTISETEHLLVGVLPTHASFFCELPVCIFWSFLYWAIISTTNIFAQFVVFLLVWLTGFFSTMENFEVLYCPIYLVFPL